MDFLSLGDLGVYNGADLILFVDFGDRIELRLTQDTELEVEDAATMAYLRAYAAAKQFFMLGQISFNPAQVHLVDVDGDAGMAYITDANGETWTVEDAAEIGVLQAAAGTFVWMPPES